MSDLISNLISRVKRRGQIPTNQVGYTDTDLLAFLQEEIEETVLPWYYGINENFGIVDEYRQFQDASGNVLYPLGLIPWPTRAFGRNLRRVCWIDENTNPYNLPIINIDDEDMVSKNSVRYPLQRSVVGFTPMSDGIRIWGDVATFTGQMKLTYPVKSSTLVNSTTLSVPITAFNFDATSSTTTFTVTVAADFATTIPENTTVLVDIFRMSTGCPLLINVMVTRVGNQIATTSLSSDEYTELAAFQQGGFLGAGNTLSSGYVADIYVAPAGQANYSQLPPELDQLLILGVVDRYLEAQGDTEGLAVNAQKMKKAQDNLVKLFGKRITGEPKVYVNRRGIRSWAISTWPRRW